MSDAPYEIEHREADARTGTVHELTVWLPMDEPVGAAFKWAGPTGEMEVSRFGTLWRMHRYGTLVEDFNE